MSRASRNHKMHLSFLLTLAWLGVAMQLAGATGPNNPEPEAGVTLILAKRPICDFRTTLDGYSPEERKAAAVARVDLALARAKTMVVSTQAVPAGIQLCLDGKALFVITPSDVSDLRQTVDSEAATAVTELRKALLEMNSLSTSREIFVAIGKSLLGVGLFAALLWGIRRGKRWLLARSTQVAVEKTDKITLRGLRTAGLRGFVIMLRGILNFASYMLIAFAAYVVLCFELRCFPYSRPWGNFLRAQGISVLSDLGDGVLAALPRLMVAVVIVMTAKLLTQVLSRLFATAESGEMQTRRLDPASAATTRRILVFLVWVMAAVVAYPYIPGSQTLAFKGVTVFVGLLVSLGSSSLFSQIASGLLLVYSRAFRPGDYVRVGESEGTVLGVGLCVTRIRTIKNEEVHIANSVLLGTATTNYTRLAESDGLFLPVQVTIGYSTPWRQVHAMLLEAVHRTSGLAQEPHPFVLQARLSDFYVEYELNACLQQPERRVWVLSDLHSHIQDVFNEHGVQIMSPHYWQDPPKPHLVPKSDWFLPPACEQNAHEIPSPESNASHSRANAPYEIEI